MDDGEWDRIVRFFVWAGPVEGERCLFVFRDVTAGERERKEDGR